MSACDRKRTLRALGCGRASAARRAARGALQQDFLIRPTRGREQGSNPGDHAIVRYLASASAAPKAAKFFLVSSSFDASLALASISRIVGRSPGKMLAAQASLVSRMAALKSRALAGFIPRALVMGAPSIVSALPARALVKPSERAAVRCAGCSMNRNEAWVTRAEMRMMKLNATAS